MGLQSKPQAPQRQHGEEHQQAAREDGARRAWARRRGHTKSHED